MEWLEAEVLPEECASCQEEDCYNCDNAGKRWYLSREDTLRLQRKNLERAIKRLQRRLEQVDRELKNLEKFCECE